MLKRSTTRTLIGLAVCAASVLAGSVAPTSAAGASSNRFVGAWISEDLPEGTLIRLNVAANGRFHNLDEDVLSPSCDGFVNWAGTGVFDTHTDGKPRFAVVGDRYCHGVGGRFFLNTTPDIPDLLAFTYDEATDTLLFLGDDPALGIGCYYRAGADPSICN